MNIHNVRSSMLKIARGMSPLEYGQDRSSPLEASSGRRSALEYRQNRESPLEYGRQRRSSLEYGRDRESPLEPKYRRRSIWVKTEKPRSTGKASNGGRSKDTNTRSTAPGTGLISRILARETTTLPKARPMPSTVVPPAASTPRDAAKKSTEGKSKDQILDLLYNMRPTAVSPDKAAQPAKDKKNSGLLLAAGLLAGGAVAGGLGGYAYYKYRKKKQKEEEKKKKQSPKSGQR